MKIFCSNNLVFTLKMREKNYILPFQYFIGEYYRYARSRKKFKLVCVRGWCFEFECGHWCTDTIFGYLIRLKTNKQVSEETQMILF